MSIVFYGAIQVNNLSLFLVIFSVLIWDHCVYMLERIN